MTSAKQTSLTASLTAQLPKMAPGDVRATLRCLSSGTNVVKFASFNKAFQGQIGAAVERVAAEGDHVQTVDVLMRWVSLLIYCNRATNV